MDRAAVDRVKELIAEQLGPAISAAEGRMMAVATTLVEDVRGEVRKDHGENRIRFEQNYNLATKAVAQNEYIIENQKELKADNGKTQALLTDLIRSVGQREGSDKAERAFEMKAEKQSSRRTGYLKAALGVAGSSFVIEAVRKGYAYFHGR